jgi:hypothetical protein
MSIEQHHTRMIDMKDLFQMEMRALEPILQFPWDNARAYAQFLAQTYHYICHSTRLLGLCASRIGVDREKLHNRFLRHAAEERGHHLLAERDVRRLGFSLHAMPELPMTAALYETQYYRAEHVGPTAIFGYILALEGIGVVHGGRIYEAARMHHTEEACAFIKLHATEDPGHLESAFAAIAALTEAERETVAGNLRFTRRLYLGFLQAICQESA